MPDVRQRSFYEILTAAVADFIDHGYDDPDRLQTWVDAIRTAAERELVPEREMVEALRRSFTAVFIREVERGAIMKRHVGLDRFTLAKVKPKLRAELDRRIAASADLIRLNRAAAIETTLRRFSGWATSLPVGGTETVDRRSVKTQVRKSLASLPFRERRVAVDQGHKFLANLSEVLATDGGAIAGVWRQHFTHHPRPTHAVRNGKVYLVKGSWAHKSGLVKPVFGYTDDITRPGEEVLCRCTYHWLHSLGRLPAAMLTAKGQSELERVQTAA